MTKPGTILLATTNRGKLAEFRALLPGGMTVLSLLDMPVDMPEETGETFEENALLKASAAAAFTGMITVADDSGLEVNALAGQPGVRSARFSGAGATSESNIEQLLHLLQDVPLEQRQARFRAVLAVVHPGGSAETFEGSCEGFIGLQKTGQGGFGYDPVFYFADGRSMAELGMEEKNRISHRGQAVKRWLDTFAINSRKEEAGMGTQTA